MKRVRKMIDDRLMSFLALILIYVLPLHGVGSTQPCASTQFSSIAANITDQDYITAILTSKDDPKWCTNSSNSDSQFYGYLCIYYSNSGNCLPCVTICERSEEECASVWRCGRFPQKTDRTKLNVTFYMVHTNEWAYRPTTTQSSKTIQNLTISNTTQISATPRSHAGLTSTEKPSWLSGGPIAGLVLGPLVALALIVLGVLLLVRYGIPYFKKRQCEYQMTSNDIHAV